MSIDVKFFVDVSLPAVRVPGRNGEFKKAFARVDADGRVSIFLNPQRPDQPEHIPAFVLANDGDYEKLRIALLDVVAALP